MMRNLLLAIATGLVGAAVLHIVIVLALPAWTGKDAFSRAQELGETHRFFTLANEPNITGFYNDDPHIRSAVCRFDLSQDPVRIIARGNVALWMLSIFTCATGLAVGLTVFCCNFNLLTGSSNCR